MTLNEVKLDLRDRKILFELEKNARSSLPQIARKAGLSKEAIFHRLKNYENRGIIKRYVTNINVYRLGYSYYPLLLKFKDTTPEIEKEILDFLKSNRYMAWMTTCEGNWDINLTLFAKNNQDLDLFLNDFLSKYSRYVAEKEIFITTDMYYFKHNFELNKTTFTVVRTVGEKSVILEELDLHLLKLLAENARMPLVEIASELGTSAKVVVYHINRLEKQKIITGSNILVDFSKLGYKFYKVWFGLQEMNPSQWKKLLTFLHSIPNLVWATKLIGKYDLSIEMEVKDVVEFRQILNSLKKEFSANIKSHESILIFEELVLNYLPKF